MRTKYEQEQRARLEAGWAQETDPVMREARALATRAGFDWYDTESAARSMAEHAAEELLELRKELEHCRKGKRAS
jgi:hypothetical protein